MKIWDMMKSFWVMTGEVDVNPEEDKNNIRNTNKLSAEDRALLMRTLQDVETKTQNFIDVHYTSHFSEQLKAKSPVKGNEKAYKARNEKEIEKEDDLLL